MIPLTAGRIKKTYSVLTGLVRPKMLKNATISDGKGKIKS